MLAVAGYAVSTTGAGAGIGAAMSLVGNAIAVIGPGLKLAANINDKSYGQAVITAAGAMTNFGVTKLGVRKLNCVNKKLLILFLQFNLGQPPLPPRSLPQ